MVVTVPRFFYVASEWSVKEGMKGGADKAAGKMPKAALMFLFSISMVIAPPQFCCCFFSITLSIKALELPNYILWYKKYELTKGEAFPLS